MRNQLSPLTAPFPDEVAAILSTYPSQDGYILSLFRTFANSARFLKKGVPNLLDRGSPLDLRTREIVILRVTANRNCAYEWGVHVAYFAKAAKLTDGQIQATRLGRHHSAKWTPREERLIEAIDQFCETGTLTDGVLKAFETDWTVEEQLEILALIGTYTTISLVANVAQLPSESFAPPFPAGTIVEQQSPS